MPLLCGILVASWWSLQCLDLVVVTLGFVIAVEEVFCITLFKSIIMLCGADIILRNIPHIQSKYRKLSKE